ncbi:MAG: WecB/TagA/CpsF family glycosyltransferase [Spirochaetaceae bacterium]|jgi:N-acetylglucosaminyldiphosphoundecaprenol N-acetyl-beta-D-mannosaminyltransferase|nr:WecB/TagA/CpsF family glycosyltransferase [Spirochaetaceae bacterium]
MAFERINVVGVPVDLCPPEDLERVVLTLLDKPGTKQIVFLSVWDLLNARRKNIFGECIRSADLILPVSRSILWGASFLKKSVPVRYSPFLAVISILTILETHYKSLYILGGKKKRLLEAERNIRQTYRNLKIVGRYIGNIPRSKENDVILAVNKASPSLVLLCEGVASRINWAFRRRNKLTSGIYLYYPHAVGVFSKHKKRISDETFEKGHEIWVEIVRNPFKVLLVFPFLKYILLLLGYRLFKRGQ